MALAAVQEAVYQKGGLKNEKKHAHHRPYGLRTDPGRIHFCGIAIARGADIRQMLRDGDFSINTAELNMDVSTTSGDLDIRKN